MVREKKVGSDAPNDVVEKEDNEKWTSNMDDVLTATLINEEAVGNRVCGTFTSTAYDNVLNELFFKLGKGLTKQQVKNRLKMIKKNFNGCYDIFKGGMSGFSWNPSTNMWGAKSEVGKSLIEVKHLAGKWMNIVVPNYDKLSSLFVFDRASGLGAETAKEKAKRWATENEQHEDLEDDHDYNTVQENIDKGEQTSQATAKSTTCSSSTKRKREDNLDETLQLLALSAHESNKILKERNNVLKKTFEMNRRKEEMYEELIKLGLDAATRMKAYNLLVRNPVKMKGFFCCVPKDCLEFINFQMRTHGAPR